MAFAFSRIGVRVAAPAVFLAAGLTGTLYWVQRTDANRQSQETLAAYTDLVNRIVLADLREAMLAKDRARLQRELGRFAEFAPIKALRILDGNGQTVFATEPTDRGETVPVAPRPAASGQRCAPARSLGAEPLRRACSLRLTAPDGSHLFRTVQPILLDEACTRCHELPAGTEVGELVVDLDDDVLTGAQRASSQRTAWSVAAAAVGCFALLALLLGRNVVVRLRRLRHLLELLRTGARATVLSVGSADEIDEVTRAVQALTLDLDGRLSLERAGRRLEAVLEQQPGAAVLLDDRGWVVAANRLAVARSRGQREGVIGGPLSQFSDLPAGMLADARAAGWALPAGEEDGPALLAMRDSQGRTGGFLAFWLETAATVASRELPQPPPPPADWQLYAAVLAESLRPAAQTGATALRFDVRLGRVRRLAADLAVVAAEAAAEREEVDLKSLALILLWDLHRDLPNRRWHTLRDTAATAPGARYQLRELMQRLARTAGAQAGPGGHVVLFAEESAAKVLLAAWAGRAGGEAVLDPTHAPALAAAVAAAHGGGVEVDPAFDLAEINGFSSLKLSGPSLGTLYVAELSTRATASPTDRTWHDRTMHR